MTLHNPKLILASSSPIRKILMERLHIPFTCLSPDVDETEKPGESHQDLVIRLSKDKAQKIGQQYPEAFVIGSDAIASLSAQILGKPMDHQTAVEQLLAASGKTVEFLTGVSVFHASSNRILSEMVRTEVTFRKLTLKRIEYYLKTAQPYQSSGSLHSEGLGILLIERWKSDDPTALMGLPLIKLTQMLETMGFQFEGDS